MEVFSTRTRNICLLLLTFNLVFISADRGCTDAEMAEDNLKKLATANNDFALKLLSQLSQTPGNVFFSPFSISSAFGMLFYGTRGTTSEELRATLGYEKADLPNELVHSSFNLFLTSMLSAKDLDNPEYTLKLANAVLLDKELKLVPTYKSEVQNFYQASVEDVDFLKDAATIANDINLWVKAKTNGKIERLLDELSPTTVMVLLNAVYFKGTWKTQFKPEKTIPQKFYNGGLDSGAKDIPTMHLKAKFPYTSFEDLQALELPYKGGNISMVVLLPNERNGLRSLQNSLSLDKLSSIRKQLYETTVFLSLPKFKIQYSKEMSSDIQTLGANNVFNAGMADFSGMTTSKNVYVSQVLHKAVVEINEEGSEAAAVTGIISNRMRPMLDTPPEFTVDHPFLFAIVDKRTDMILFVGHVNEL